jgi:RNA polymerase sigma factor (sigma-70 family)
MVLGVCQSILQDTHDAEDAFQATFLVLVRKPNAIGKPGAVASWLHGVAYRLATRARVEAARRRVRERQVATMPKIDPQEELIWRDLRPVLHQEVDRLPERYRLPFVLCYLEGKTNEEAADLLGWPKGTVLSSLSRARERLRARLTRRGLVVSGGLLAAVLSQRAAEAAVPAALAESTLRAALSFAAGATAMGGTPALVYAERMLQAIFLGKLKLTALILLTAGMVGTAVGVLVYGTHENSMSGQQSPTVNISQGSPAPAANQASPPLEKDKDKLQGAWVVISAEQQGEEIAALNGRRLVFEGDHFVLWAGGEVSGILPSARLEGDFTLEPASPSRIELNSSTGSSRIELRQKNGPTPDWELNRKNWHLHGSYSLEGTMLRIHLSNANEDRPGQLDTEQRSRELLLILKRFVEKTPARVVP